MIGPSQKLSIFFCILFCMLANKASIHGTVHNVNTGRDFCILNCVPSPCVQVKKAPRFMALRVRWIRAPENKTTTNKTTTNYKTASRFAAF